MVLNITFNSHTRSQPTKPRVSPPTDTVSSYTAGTDDEHDSTAAAPIGTQGSPLSSSPNSPAPLNRPNIPIPQGMDIAIHIGHRISRVHREYLTCFKCGGPHHFKSECSTWRTRLCNKWKHGKCDEQFCAFAHGTMQLRQPWRLICINTRIIRS